MRKSRDIASSYILRITNDYALVSMAYNVQHKFKVRKQKGLLVAYIGQVISVKKVDLKLFLNLKYQK